MAPSDATYGLLQVSETFDSDLEGEDVGSASHGAQTVTTHGYGLLQVSESLNTDVEGNDFGSASHGGQAVTARGGARKYVKIFAMSVLLVGAVGIYFIGRSPSEVTQAQTSSEANADRFYEVEEDTPDSTPPPSGTVAGQLSMQVSNPDQFLTDPVALQATKESIAAIAGVPVTAVTDVKMLSMSGGSSNVQAVYTINAPDGNTNAVAEKINSSTPEADSQILTQKIADAGLSATYPDTSVQTAAATPGPTPNPCDTTLAPNPCDTTLAPNPCDTTQAPGMLARLFR